MFVLLILLISYYTVHYLVAVRPRSQKRQKYLRSEAVREFRLWIAQLERERFYRTGNDNFTYLKRLPPYETMMEDELPLKLDTYFFDSEIRHLLCTEKEPIG